MDPGFRSKDPNGIAVDDRIVAPESRAEIVEGQLHMSPPADEKHAVPHATLAYILGAHVASSFVVALDMLTRTSETSDFAPDVSVFPLERVPETGGRQLEHLAFEIVNEQALAVQTTKARELVRRGVRRVFCVVVQKKKLLEWSRETDSWAATPLETIDDPCFTRPVSVAALLGAASADDAVAAALRAKSHPAFGKAREEGREEGLRVAVRDLCDAFSIPLDADRDRTVSSMSATELDALRSALKRDRSWPS